MKRTYVSAASVTAEECRTHSRQRRPASTRIIKAIIHNPAIYPVIDGEAGVGVGSSFSINKEYQHGNDYLYVR